MSFVPKNYVEESSEGFTRIAEQMREVLERFPLAVVYRNAVGNLSIASLDGDRIVGHINLMSDMGVVIYED